MLSQDPLACMSAFRIIVRSQCPPSLVFVCVFVVHGATLQWENGHAKTSLVQLPLAKVDSLEGYMPV